jgi:hypothetical protein
MEDLVQTVPRWCAHLPEVPPEWARKFLWLTEAPVRNRTYDGSFAGGAPSTGTWDRGYLSKLVMPRPARFRLLIKGSRGEWIDADRNVSYGTSADCKAKSGARFQANEYGVDLWQLQ